MVFQLEELTFLHFIEWSYSDYHSNIIFRRPKLWCIWTTL